MFCKNCGANLKSDEKFCSNCGTQNINNTESNGFQSNEFMNNQPIGSPGINAQNSFQNNYMNQQRTDNYNQNGGKNKKYIKFIIGGVVALIIAIVIICTTLTHISGDSDNLNSDNQNTDLNNDSNNNSSIENESTSIKGEFTREVFSGHSFDYDTMYDNAVFKFNKDSSFEVNYVGGNTYKGTYEVYNGLYIAIKADDIKNDKTISNGELLANDINTVANAMMDDTKDMLNTYLLWLKVDNDIIQPFVISYNSETNSGTAVNILGRTQGSFTLKID